MFEVDSGGHVVFDMINTDPESKEFSYRVSDAPYFPVEEFDFSTIECST